MKDTEQIFFEEVVRVVDPCSGECAVEKGSFTSQQTFTRENKL